MLGLIAEQGPVSGYDLLRTFRISMEHYWYAQHGQIYPTLQRLERGGLIQSREVIQQGRPNKHLFTLTSDGRQELIRWLESPYEGLRLKHAPLLRCRFLGHLGRERARAQLLEHRAASALTLEAYRGLERRFFGAPRSYSDVNSMFVYFTLRAGITLFEHTIQWCDWAIAEIERNRGLFAKSAAARQKLAPFEIQRAAGK